MTKSELVEQAAEQSPHLSRRDVELVVNTIFESITDALGEEQRVEIRGFGTFQVRRRKARQGRNPKTGEEVRVPAKRVPFFKAGRKLKELVGRALPAGAPGAEPGDTEAGLR